MRRANSFPARSSSSQDVCLSGGAGELVCPLRSASESVERRIPLVGSGGGLAARAWADLHVRRLLALDDPRLHRMVVALSQSFALANQAASFLILEKDADYEIYDVKSEQVDLANLERLRDREIDQRRDRLVGLAIDELPQGARALVRSLEERFASVSLEAPIPRLDLPLAGGAERAEAEADYREARAEDPRSPMSYEAVARARAAAGDTSGAIRALSCLVENDPASAEASRFVGYACLALAQYEDAASLFARVRRNRPFEPQSYLEEAFALEAQGLYGRAARNYEIILGASLPPSQGRDGPGGPRQLSAHARDRGGAGGLDGESAVASGDAAQRRREGPTRGRDRSRARADDDALELRRHRHRSLGLRARRRSRLLQRAAERGGGLVRAGHHRWLRAPSSTSVTPTPAASSSSPPNTTAITLRVSARPLRCSSSATAVPSATRRPTRVASQMRLLGTEAANLSLRKERL